MAADRYRALPMLVELSAPCDRPHPLALTGPKGWRPDLSRKVFHETLHYWQHISQGFLIRMTAEDWRRLQEFEETRRVPPAGPLKRAFVARDPEAGFSPRDLMEAHARFWDVHALGPPRVIEADLANPDRDTSDVLTAEEYERHKAEGRIWREILPNDEGRGYSGFSFDLAMRMAGGAYARPYLEMRDATDTYSAGVLFPLVAHAAMQSDTPVATYSRLIRKMPVLDPPDPPPWIEGEWRRLYPVVLRAALEDAQETTGREFLSGRHVIDASGLARHPGYHLAAASMAIATRHLVERRQPYLMFADTGMPEAMRADWTLDFLLGCAGMTAARQLDLLCYLAPPWVRFGNGHVWVPGSDFDAVMPQMEVQPWDNPFAAIRHAYPGGLAAIEARQAAFLRAAIAGAGA